LVGKENQGPHEIKRLGLDPLNELRGDAGNLLIMDDFAFKRPTH